MDDLHQLLIRKQEPWYKRMPQSVMEIRLISLDERHIITNKFKEFFQESKINLNCQFYKFVIEENRDNTLINRPKI